MRPKGLLITIDGPAGAGKSTIAKKLAARLGYLYLDTGAMYRSVALAAKEKGLSFEDEERLALLAQKLDLRLKPSENGVKVILEGKDVSQAIRTPEIDRLSSLVARIPGVRKALAARQKELGKDGGIVAEGRDMGSFVFPDADLKFFLTASPEERARRRLLQLEKAGHKADYETILKEIIARDERDRKREIAPLVVPEGAIVIDTSEKGPEEVLEIILARVKEKLHA